MTRRRRIKAAIGGLALLGLLAGGAGALAQGSKGEEATACGTPGTAPCPLQAFMRSRVASPLASHDVAALAHGLDRAARLAPDPTWASWAGFASAGAAAARQGDVAAARAACRGCHDAWRAAYRAKYRARPLPE